MSRYPNADVERFDQQFAETEYERNHRQRTARETKAKEKPMTKYAFLDVETSGLFDFKKPADDPSQPYMASFAMLLTDEALEVTHTIDLLIYPDGWEISPEVTQINGLTTDACRQNGVPITEAMAAYTEAVREGYVMVSYNAQFDLKCCRSSLRRLGLPDLFEETPNICAMRASKSLGVEKQGAKKGGFPRLTDVYFHFFKRPMEGAHTALSDATACLEVFRELMKIGACPPPAVHYAKEKPEAKAKPADDMEVSP